MTLELRVVGGARSGVRERFDQPVVTVGRHPRSDLRFDAQVDLDVSTRHAELRRVDGRWRIRDEASANGTFVNGERLEGERTLEDGDTISFGASGPRVEVRLSSGDVDTRERIAAVVRRETRLLRLGFLVAVALLIAAGVVGLIRWRLSDPARPARVAGAPARAGAAAIHARNDAAVAMIASDLDGTFLAGTAFGVSRSGLLVTNRHIVRAESGAAPRRVRVLYANRRDWLPAHVVRTSDSDDLALIQLDVAGTYPVVEGVSRDGARAEVGAPITSIGFPLAADTPMEGTGLHVTARTTTASGAVSKRLAEVLQIDSYAGKGSSGSPVFEAGGLVVGVVYGGAAESNGRIVYAVPAERLVAFLGADAGVPRR